MEKSVCSDPPTGRSRVPGDTRSLWVRGRQIDNGEGSYTGDRIPEEYRVFLTTRRSVLQSDLPLFTSSFLPDRGGRVPQTGLQGVCKRMQSNRS